MAYDLIIANGTVLHAHGHEKADIAIRGEQIVAVAPGLAQSANGAKVVQMTRNRVEAHKKYYTAEAREAHILLEDKRFTKTRVANPAKIAEEEVALVSGTVDDNFTLAPVKIVMPASSKAKKAGQSATAVGSNVPTASDARDVVFRYPSRPEPVL